MELLQQKAEEMRLLMNIIESKEAMSERLSRIVSDAMTGRGSRLSHPGYPFAGKSKEAKAKAADEQRMVRAAAERRRRALLGLPSKEELARMRREEKERGPAKVAAQELLALEAAMGGQAADRAEEERREHAWDRVHGQAFRDGLPEPEDIV